MLSIYFVDDIDNLTGFTGTDGFYKLRHIHPLHSRRKTHSQLESSRHYMDRHTNIDAHLPGIHVGHTHSEPARLMLACGSSRR